MKELEARENKLMNVLKSKAQLEILAVEDLKKVVSGELFNGVLKPGSVVNQPAKRWR